ncbi:hypothetical protein B0O99DRAFT_504018 [Bisporella sp. PMI_857]|nr:hypothetical protein B0O99DRAFT_504018 [Bisporella sp. PMI_857]
MVLKARRRQDELDGELKEGLLASGCSSPRSIRKRRTFFNYCIFGGISGLTILLFLLLTNLTLGIATLIWNNEFHDSALKNWGKPGTGTEGLAWYPSDFTRDIVPIPCHSHNDYWRRVPLFSALRAGCTGIEADVWLFDQELYVGHNTASLTRNRTFQNLYINPLVKILEDQNKKTDFYNGTSHGVFDEDPGKALTLLVDVKTEGATTWPWVLAQLQPLRERGWLTFVENGKVHSRAVTVVGTGNTPFDVLTKNHTYRDAFFDAPLNEMWEPRDKHSAEHGESSDVPEKGEEPKSSPSGKRPANVGQGLSGVLPGDEFSPENSYYASVSLNEAVGQIWRGHLTPKQINIIRGQIRGAHRRGLKVRYWDTPSWPIGLRNHVWEVLIREGADILNVDDLRAASRQVW